MSLYAKKAVPFRHDDDSDEDSLPKKKAKVVPKPPVKVQPVKSKPVVDISFDMDDDEVEEDTTESSNRILKELEAKKKIVVATKAAPEVVDIAEDEVIAKAQKLLQKAQFAKQKKVAAIDIVDLDHLDPSPVKSSYVPVRIARANERKAINIDEGDNTIEYMLNLTQSSTGNHASSSSSSNSSSAQVAAAADDGPRVKLVTRLNGEHEWKWRIPTNDSFGKVSCVLCGL